MTYQMKIVSVNVGRPIETAWKGKTITTGIFKSPVKGPVALRKHNLDGDEQADLSVHGGPTKAVYVYPLQHYDYWREELAPMDLQHGSFGENFTMEGVDEESVCIGDQFKIGTARVYVTEPRMPCYKLAVKFGRDDMVKMFLKSQRPGFYLGILEEGQVEAGDTFEAVTKGSGGLKVADVNRLYTTDRENAELLRKAISTPALPASWKGYFEHLLEKLNPPGSE